MSHYTLVKSQIRRISPLIKALQKLGFQPHMIEYSENLLPLKGYQGDIRKQKANIRIKGSGWRGENYVGNASNDLGFERLEDGTYAFHVSQYDQMKYNSNWQTKLMNQYSCAVIHEECLTHGFFIEEKTEEADEINMVLTSPF